ncbi:MAG TPA: hypothetical protein VFB15_12105 [Candidatus Binataceae bacterium]|jgi:hypothetical protein|nr:hypothetical protein [Candidatus Binataceae bacterium]
MGVATQQSFPVTKEISEGKAGARRRFVTLAQVRHALMLLTPYVLLAVAVAGAIFVTYSTMGTTFDAVSHPHSSLISLK